MSKEARSEVRCRLAHSAVNELEAWVDEEKLGNRQALLERIIDQALRKRRHAVTMRKSRQRRAAD